MISQFHPCVRQFVRIAHENTVNSVGNHYLQTELPFVPFMVKDTRKISQFSLVNKQSNEYIYTYKKVTQWLEDLDCDLQRKKINNTIDQDIDVDQHHAVGQNNSL
jgi:hypothetical protein